MSTEEPVPQNPEWVPPVDQEAEVSLTSGPDEATAIVGEAQSDSQSELQLPPLPDDQVEPVVDDIFLEEPPDSVESTSEDVDYIPQDEPPSALMVPDLPTPGGVADESEFEPAPVEEEELPVAEAETAPADFPVETAPERTLESEPEAANDFADEYHPDAPEEAAAEPVAAPSGAPKLDDDLESTGVRRRRLLARPPAEDTSSEEKPEWEPRVIDEPAPMPTKEDLQSSVFEGATVVPTIPSRKAAHAWYFLIALVMTPITWYLVSDSQARLTMRGGQWDTGILMPFTLAEVGLAAVALIVLLLPARWSSLGAFLAAILNLGVGIPFLVVPQQTADFLAPALRALENFNEMGGNIAHHLVADGSTGRFVFYGIGLFLVGIISHGARRKGRKDTLNYERVEGGKSPEGLEKNSRKARRASAKAEAKAAKRKRSKR